MNSYGLMPRYAPLFCKTNYAFLEGASHPEEIVEEAARLGIHSLTVCDRDGVYGVVRAHVKARELGVHLIIGSHITIDDGSTIVLLAQDRAGYANLCQLLSTGRLRSTKGESKVSWHEACEHAEGLVALWGGESSAIAGEADPLFVARDLRDAFGDRLYALLTRHRRADDVSRERRVRDRAARYGIATVAGMEVLYHDRSRRDLQDILTCIRHGVTISEASKVTRANAEHHLRSPHGFVALYEDDPASVARTITVAERCTFSLDEIRYRYPAEKLPDGTTSHEYLRHLTFEGARERYPLDRYPDGIPNDVASQLDKELDLIRDLDYDGYFLTMWEIVQFCRRNGILCQGRGSAANSAVCYCLGITAIDPVQMGLLFERFLSKERAEPPDIDLDIEHNRREEVIQYVYQKYGRSHAAMVANFVRYRARSAFREVGKVLEMSDTALDRLAKLISHYDTLTPATLKEIGIDPENPRYRHLARLAIEIQDFPRHLSIHPGGFLLGHEPVRSLVPIENATMPDRTVIQWDKEDLESLGLFKVDLLGLGMLTVLHESFDLLERHTGERLTMATVPQDDGPTYEMIRRADTIGTFQIESRAQMAMLPRLKPRNYYDIVIEVSIVRPGPITGGMVHPYLRRRNGEEEVVYPHPCLEPVLKKTLGVPLFQEQVMRLAVLAADYTPGEADQLRRDMAAWRRSGRLERHKEKLITRMMAKGIELEFAERVFEQIRGFGDYGFPESHAASFAYIAYISAWLKCHHPAVFTCALLNAQPMGFYAPATIIDDAKRHGVTVLPVSVQTSDWDCSLVVGCDDGCRPPVARSHTKVKARAQSRALPIIAPHDTFEGHEQTIDITEDHKQACRGSTDPLRGAREDPPVCRAPRLADRAGAWVRSAPCTPDGPPAVDAPCATTASTAGGIGDGARGRAGTLRVRIGLRYVKGLREHLGRKIEEERRNRPFTSIDDFARRTGCDDGAMTRLAEAGAFEDLEAERRSAIWRVRGVDRPDEPDFPMDAREPAVAFDALNDFETIGWDYDTTGHSTRGHPLSPLRPALARQGLPDAQTVWGLRNGARVRYAGIVINRQRPSTAKGVVFMTLEDETGFVNLVVWQTVFRKYAVVAKTESFLGVTGKIQSESGVVHVVAESFWTPKLGHKPRRRRSRDFH